MDFLYMVEEAHLDDVELKKGIMQLIDEGKTAQILDSLKHEKIVPAGGTTNTLMGLAALGAKCILIGQVGSGEFGLLYEDLITKEGIKPRLMKSEKKTGKVLNFITPDADRTFGVHLGAATELTKDAIIEEDIKHSRYLYTTGYEIESVGDTVMHAIEFAKKHRVKIVVDLADPDLINRNKELIVSMLPDFDIVFLNEDEAKSLTGLGPEAAAMEIGKQCNMVVVKKGPLGSVVFSEGALYDIEPVSAKPVDTTGAGDLYAAGFLFGLIRGKSIEEAGKLGSFMGGLVVEQMGAYLDEEFKDKIKEMLH